MAHEQKKFGFLQKEVLTSRSQQELDRFLTVAPIKDRNIVGVGISTPYFWEGWQNILKTKNIFDQEWNSEIVTELFKVPNVKNVIVENDGSSAALGEKTFGAGVEYKDFLYVNIGTFIGGGLVIDGTLRTGAHGNTAALAPFPISYSTNPSSEDSARPFEQLLSRASLNSLEEYAQRNNYQLDFANFDSNEYMEDINYLEDWIKDCSSALAQFFIGVWSIIDIESIILDGALPKPVLQKIIDTTQSHVRDFQIEGIIPSDVKQGEHGLLAQSIGAACLPILSILGPPPIGRIGEEAVFDKSGMQLAS